MAVGTRILKTIFTWGNIRNGRTGQEGVYAVGKRDVRDDLRFCGGG